MGDRYEGLPEVGARVFNRAGTEGGEVRGYRACTLEGCPGMRLCVRWPDGTRTWPCTKGMRVNEDGTWQII